MIDSIINTLAPVPLTLLLLLLITLLAWFKPVKTAVRETYKVFVQVFKALSYTVPFIAFYALVNSAGRGLEALAFSPETQETIVQASNTIEKVQQGLGATSRATQAGLDSINFGVIAFFILGAGMIYLLFKKDKTEPTPEASSKKKKGK